MGRRSCVPGPIEQPAVLQELRRVRDRPPPCWQQSVNHHYVHSRVFLPDLEWCVNDLEPPPSIRGGHCSKCTVNLSRPFKSVACLGFCHTATVNLSGIYCRDAPGHGLRRPPVAQPWGVVGWDIFAPTGWQHEVLNAAPTVGMAVSLLGLAYRGLNLSVLHLGLFDAGRDNVLLATDLGPDVSVRRLEGPNGYGRYRNLVMAFPAPSDGSGLEDTYPQFAYAPLFPQATGKGPARLGSSPSWDPAATAAVRSRCSSANSLQRTRHVPRVDGTCPCRERSCTSHERAVRHGGLQATRRSSSNAWRQC